ncbi:MAG: methyltransferase domain-containing protein [Alteromonadaceae bacterium]|nr:methyltransferase domain-containing protein [Alteromonadaceae bacterium]
MAAEESNIQQYQTYFASGHYDRRYPRPNRHVMSHAHNLMPSGGRVLDFGCGTGRYLIPLYRSARACLGFDVSSEALKTLNERLEALGCQSGVKLIGPELDALRESCEQVGGVDLSLCLFGVLAHVGDSRQRADILACLGQSLAPGGRLLISVPNRRRRFLREQRCSDGSGQISYTRDCQGSVLELSYQLYDADSLVEELEHAGYQVERLLPESILPESWLSNRPILAAVDHWLCRWLPAEWGYGLLAVAYFEQQENGKP